MGNQSQQSEADNRQRLRLIVTDATHRASYIHKYTNAHNGDNKTRTFNRVKSRKATNDCQPCICVPARRTTRI